MRMHCNLRGAAKQEAQPSPATYSKEDSTYGDVPTVGSVHISCNELINIITELTCGLRSSDL